MNLLDSFVSKDSMNPPGRKNPYRSNPVAVAVNDGYVCAALAVVGLGDGTEERLLVHGDCFSGASRDWEAVSGGESALLDWAAWVDGPALG